MAVLAAKITSLRAFRFRLENKTPVKTTITMGSSVIKCIRVASRLKSDNSLTRVVKRRR